MKNNNLFSEKKTKKTSTKYFIISFSLFVVILAVFSVAVLMHSLDYDINNLFGISETSATEPTDETESNIYSVKDLTGKSNLLFVLKVEKAVDYICIVSTDFDKKTMTVKCIDGTEKMPLNNTSTTVNSVYSADFEQGIKKLLNANGFAIDKYVIFEENQLKDVLSLFNGFSINVENNVNYKSQDFNLNIEKGLQELSPDLTYKYLKISNSHTREKIVCDIIKSVLTSEYSENSQKLFTSFVNLCETDISVIDYSEVADKLKIYSNAEDKFYPEVFVESDK